MRGGREGGFLILIVIFIANVNLYGNKDIWCVDFSVEDMSNKYHKVRRRRRRRRLNVIY